MEFFKNCVLFLLSVMVICLLVEINRIDVKVDNIDSDLGIYNKQHFLEMRADILYLEAKVEYLSK